MEHALAARLPQPDKVPARLHEAMRYSVLGGGKRIRPALLFATARTLGLSEDDVEAAACAIELVHVYSLVHDDLPAMDNDDLRRGRPTCHKAYDEATALLVGDALQPLAFQILVENVVADRPEAQIEMLKILAEDSRKDPGNLRFDILQQDGRLNHLPIIEAWSSAGAQAAHAGAAFAA